MARSNKKANKEETGEVATAEETIAGTAQVTTALQLPPGAKVKRHVTLPTLVLKEAGRQVCVHILDAMRVSKIQQKEKDTNREPATICTVGDPTTGELFIFLVPAVVKANLERDYPKDAYVRKTFVFQNKGKRTPSQRYNDFAIVEVDVPGTEQFAGVNLTK